MSTDVGNMFTLCWYVCIAVSRSFVHKPSSQYTHHHHHHGEDGTIQQYVTYRTQTASGVIVMYNKVHLIS